MKQTAWGIASPNKTLWHETFYTRQRAMSFAVLGCIGAHEYQRLPDDSARWQLAYRRGFRLVRVTLTVNGERT